MSERITSRREFLECMAAIGVVASLPAAALAESSGQAPVPSPFGSRSTAEEVTEGLDLTGMTFVITGCNPGLGQETMRVLALRGAHVIGIARTQAKAEAACAAVEGSTTPAFLDLADWDSIVRCAEGIRRMNVPIDGLIANAGIMALPSLELVNGFERQFAINHLGHFILINQLRDLVVAAPQGRFVVLSSDLHQNAKDGIDFDNLDGSKHYSSWEAYGVSKMANALCASELARQLRDTRATANSLHPGVIKTNLVRHLPGWQQWFMKHFGGLFLKSIPQGAATSCYVATNPALGSTRGFYFADCNISDDKSPFLDDVEMGRRLWGVSERATSDYLRDV